MIPVTVNENFLLTCSLCVDGYIAKLVYGPVPLLVSAREMDVAAFSGDTFDAKAWINKAFKHPDAQQNKEQFASTLVMKLQLMITKLNASLEEQCEQVSVGLLRPKVLRDVESLQQEAVLLQGRISDVRNEMAKNNSENAQVSMQSLVDMDKLKQRMQVTLGQN